MPHVIMVADTDWDPSTLNYNLDDNEEWFDTLSDLYDDPTSSVFDEFKEFRGWILVIQLLTIADMDHKIIAIEDAIYALHAQRIKSRSPKFGTLRLYFGWLPYQNHDSTYGCTT